MKTRDHDEGGTKMLAVPIPASLHKDLKIEAIEKDRTLAGIVTDALLNREGSLLIKHEMEENRNENLPNKTT